MFGIAQNQPKPHMNNISQQEGNQPPVEPMDSPPATQRRAVRPRFLCAAGIIIFTVSSLVAVDIWCGPFGGTYLLGNRRLSATQAARLFEGIPVSLFSVEDFDNSGVDIGYLVLKLKKHSDPVSDYVHTRLQPSTKSELAAWEGSVAPSKTLQQSLISDLNGILKGQLIWDDMRFRGVELRPGTRKLLGRTPSGEDLVRLNKRLLEDAYLEIPRLNISLDDMAEGYRTRANLDRAARIKTSAPFVLAALVGAIVFASGRSARKRDRS
jgi:hypothetical protein